MSVSYTAKGPRYIQIFTMDGELISQHTNSFEVSERISELPSADYLVVPVTYIARVRGNPAPETQTEVFDATVGVTVA